MGFEGERLGNDTGLYRKLGQINDLAMVGVPRRGSQLRACEM
jgi:hypothetical protein